MTRIRVDLEGFDELARDLNRTGSTIRRKARRVIAASTKRMVRDAVILAPVDTGTLRGSISATLDADGLGSEFGPTAEYGGYIEEGTSQMAGQPYMRPAVDRNVPQMFKAFEKIADVAKGADR